MSFIFIPCLNYRKNKRQQSDNEKLRSEVQNIISKAVKIVQAKNFNDKEFRNVRSDYINWQSEMKNTNTDPENIFRTSPVFDDASMDKQLACHEIEISDCVKSSSAKTLMDVSISQNKINKRLKLGHTVLQLLPSSEDRKPWNNAVNEVPFSRKVNRLFPDFHSYKDCIENDDCKKEYQQELYETTESRTTSSCTNFPYQNV